MLEKLTDQISLRAPDELKHKFEALVKAEGKTSSGVLLAYIEQYVREREEYVASIAPMFGYERASYKEQPRQTGQNRAGQHDVDEGRNDA